MTVSEAHEAVAEGLRAAGIAAIVRENSDGVGPLKGTFFTIVGDGWRTGTIPPYHDPPGPASVIVNAGIGILWAHSLGRYPKDEASQPLVGGAYIANRVARITAALASLSPIVVEARHE